jgi:hypothetical protein
MDNIKKYFFLILTSYPLFEYLFVEYLDTSFATTYGFLGTLLFLLTLFSGEKFRYPRYLLPLLLLTIYYFIWDVINGELMTADAVEFIKYLYKFRWLHAVSFLILIENTNFDRKFINTTIAIFKATIIISFIVSMYQQFFDQYFLMPEETRLAYFYRNIYDIRLNSIFGYLSSVDINMSFMSIVSILIGYYLYQDKNLSLLWLFMAGMVVFVNKFRYLYLNFFIILFQYIVARKVHFSTIFKLALIVPVLLFFSIWILENFGFNFNQFIQERLYAESARTRLLAIDLFMEFFPRNPFFGSGVHVGEDLEVMLAGRSTQIHVGYLSHLYSYGVVGTIILLITVYNVFKYFYTVAVRHKYYGSLFVIIVYLITNLTQVHFLFYHYGFLFAFIFNKYINDLPAWEDS